MSKGRQDSEIVFLQANAGFSRGRAYGWILPEPEYILQSPSPYCRADIPLPVALADNSPCPPGLRRQRLPGMVQHPYPGRRNPKGSRGQPAGRPFPGLGLSRRRM